MLDVTATTLEVAHAGHPPVYHRSGRTGEVVELGTSGLPLGMVPEAEYRSTTVALEPGDVLVFYTDGMYETQNREGELYGFERLQEIIREVGSEGSAAEVIERLFAEVVGFRGTLQQEDDMTSVVVRVV
jgi:sigma-B regulation protein RsbU (phosphoserine phosphatase)